MLKILLSWIWLYSAKRKDRRKGYEKKEQRTEVNYLEQIMDSKCNMSTCRKLKGCFGINEQRNLDCNIAYVIFIPYFVSTKIVFNVDDRKTRRDTLFAALNSEF